MIRTTEALLEAILDRGDLSWKAKGLACAIAMRRDEFLEPGPDKIQLLLPYGTDAESSIRTGLRELQAKGLLRMDRVRNESGMGYVTGSVWELEAECPG